MIGIIDYDAGNIRSVEKALVESVGMSVANITQNRLRSFLTILGIMIGVTAVIALITTVSGVSNSISDSFTSMGAGTMTVAVTGNDMQAGLTSANLDEIARRLYDPLAARLREELWLDRERAGLMSDV